MTHLQRLRYSMPKGAGLRSSSQTGWLKDEARLPPNSLTADSSTLRNRNFSTKGKRNFIIKGRLIRIYFYFTLNVN